MKKSNKRGDLTKAGETGKHGEILTVLNRRTRLGRKRGKMAATDGGNDFYGGVPVLLKTSRKALESASSSTKRFDARPLARTLKAAATPIRNIIIK